MISQTNKPRLRRNAFACSPRFALPYSVAVAALFAAATFVRPDSVALAVAPSPLPAAEETPPADAKKDPEAPAKDDAKAEEDKKRKKKKKDRYLVLKCGTLHTVTEGDLYGMTVLAKNGKIARIGRHVDWPLGDDVEVAELDASGFHVYPGLVAVSGGNLLGGEPPDDTTDVYGLTMTIGLAAGITTAVSGNTAAKLTFGGVEDMTVKRDLFFTLAYSSDNPEGRYNVRKELEKARQHVRDVQAFHEAKKTDPKAKEPEKPKGQAEQYVKLIRGEIIASSDAGAAQDLLDIAELARRYGFRAVVRGAHEAWIVAPQVSRAGLSAVITPRSTVMRDDRLNRPNGSSIENAAILHQHGVPFAVIPQISSITTWGLAGRDLLHLNMEAAFAVRGGLPEDAAIRAITIDAARILGIDHRVGSIEIGKDADFVVTDGDLLHYMTHSRWTIVNGRVVYDKDKEPLFEHIRKGGDRDAPPPDDYWPKRLGAE
jgi:hypothetical protein